MGSAKFPIQFVQLAWRALIALCFFVCTIMEGQTPDINDTFPNSDAVEAWAKSAFIGGYRKWLFVRGEKAVLAVVGMPSSGFATSQITLFDKSKDGKLRVFIMTRKIYGTVTPHEEGDSIIFSAKTPVLIVPWSGISLDMEQTLR